jgi:hypothetical protein
VAESFPSNICRLIFRQVFVTWLVSMSPCRPSATIYAPSQTSVNLVTSVKRRNPEIEMSGRIYHRLRGVCRLVSLVVHWLLVRVLAFLPKTKIEGQTMSPSGNLFKQFCL